MIDQEVQTDPMCDYPPTQSEAMISPIKPCPPSPKHQTMKDPDYHPSELSFQEAVELVCNGSICSLIYVDMSKHYDADLK